MTRKDAQELATVLYERRQFWLAAKVSATYKGEALHFLAEMVDVLYQRYIRQHLFSTTQRKWRNACEDGTLLYPPKEAKIGAK